MAGGSVFISYRREDAAGEAGRLSDHLARRFGTGRVFIDIDTIRPGTDFVVELDRALASTTVVLVMIGRKWLTVTNADGSRRLDSSGDFVRREIATALARGVRVVPVLVQGAAMPRATDLPDELAPLARRQASAIEHEEFGADASRLSDAIAPLIEGASPWWTRWQQRLVIGGAVVVIVLGAAGWRWFRSTAPAQSSTAPQETSAENSPLQREVDDLVRVATGQHQRRQFVEAMATLDQALAIDADVTRAKTLQEDVAMQWMRELTVTDGQTFTAAMAQPLAVLDRATPFATGARQGDLLAHLGWGSFLRRRDGDRRIDPEGLYRQALAADAMNPFANAMLGHWLLWNDGGGGDLERARSFFRIAADAARATDFARTLQFAALKNHSTVASRLEAVRVLDEMRRRGESLAAGNANDVWSTYYFAMSDNGDLKTRDLVAVLPPSEHLLTLQWAFTDVTRDNESRRQQLRYYMARLQGAAGQTAEARDALTALRAEFGPNSGGSLPDAVDRALRELGPPPAAARQKL
jgi:hypothetical protein